jgi:hypothetical protein
MTSQIFADRKVTNGVHGIFMPKNFYFEFQGLNWAELYRFSFQTYTHLFCQLCGIHRLFTGE